MRSGHDAEAEFGACTKGQGLLVRQLAQLASRRRDSRDVRSEPLDPPIEFVLRCASEQEKLRWPALAEHLAARIDAAVRMFLERDVEVCAPEAECADAGAAGMPGRRSDPWTRLAGDKEWTLGEVRLRIRRLDVVRGRQHLVIERQRGLDQSGRSRRALGVADHRFDRTDRAGLNVRPGFGEDRFEGRDLRAISGDRAGAVGLDQPDRSRREIRHVVGAP